MSINQSINRLPPDVPPGTATYDRDNPWHIGGGHTSPPPISLSAAGGMVIGPAIMHLYLVKKPTKYTNSKSTFLLGLLEPDRRRTRVRLTTVAVEKQ